MRSDVEPYWTNATARSIGGCVARAVPWVGVAIDERGLGGAWVRYQTHAFVEPAADLAEWVDHHWVVTWDYAEPYRQLLLPYPQVHLTFRDAGAIVSGVASRHQIKVLYGSGGVLGVAFWPGCFRPFLGASVSTLRDRAVDAREIFGEGVPHLSSRPSPEDVSTVETFLRHLAPAPDLLGGLAADIVARIATSAELTRVDAIAAEAGMTVRRLQRLFNDYVGIGPKWVLRRYRLHEVTRRLAAGEHVEWAALAPDLGFTDQAHLVRDFRKMFGEPPTRYAARYGSASPAVGGVRTVGGDA